MIHGLHEIRMEKLPFRGKGQNHNPKPGKLAKSFVDEWCDSNLYIWSWRWGWFSTIKQNMGEKVSSCDF